MTRLPTNPPSALRNPTALAGLDSLIRMVERVLARKRPAKTTPPPRAAA